MNIEEKLSENEVEKFKKPDDEKRVVKTKLSEEEMKELRRKQQERALKFQESVNEQIRKENDAILGKSSKIKEIQEEDEKESETDSDDEPSSNKKATETDEFIKRLTQNIEDLDLGQKFEQIEEPKKMNSSLNIKNLTFEEMLKDYENQIDRKNNQEIEKMLKFKFESGEEEAKIGARKGVKWSDVEKAKSESEGEDDEEYYEDEDKSPTTIHLKINHTRSTVLDEIERNRKVSRDKPIIETPADIYNVFFKPKSILKRPSVDYTAEESLEKFKFPTESSTASNKEIKPSNEENKPAFKFEPHKVKN